MEIPIRKKEDRPQVLPGATHRVETGIGRAYITVTWHEGQIFEIFIGLGHNDPDHKAEAEGIARLVSLCLRAHIEPEEVIDQLQDIKGTPTWYQGELLTSLEDAVSKTLRKDLASGPPDTLINLDELVLEIDGEQLSWIDQWSQENKYRGQASTFSLTVKGVDYVVAFSQSTLIIVQPNTEISPELDIKKYPSLDGKYRDFIVGLLETKPPEDAIATQVYYLKTWVGDMYKNTATCPMCKTVTHCPRCRTQASIKTEPGWIGKVLVNRDLISSLTHHLDNNDLPITIWGDEIEEKPFVLLDFPGGRIALMGIVPGKDNEDNDRIEDFLASIG